MMNKLLIVCFTGLLLVAGCAQKESPQIYSEHTLHDISQVTPAPGRAQPAAEADDATRRYIAVRHQLIAETPEDELPKAWQSVITFCQTIRCEILSSGITRKTSFSPPSANLSLRVAPEDLNPLFEHLDKVAHVYQHITSSEDKTATVVDVEARLKNMSELRDRLRTMLATPGATLKDLVEVEKELSRVQSDLDSLTARRKVLANETDKVAVDITFRAETTIAGTGVLHPISVSLKNSGHVLAESVAVLISFVVAVVPWLSILVPALWGFIKLFKSLFRKRKEKAPETVKQEKKEEGLGG